MDNSRSMQPRSGWTWKVWIGILVGLAVVVGLVVLIAANGTPAQIQTAAHSDCGKPMVAVGDGGGPPEHALEHMAAGKAHSGGEAEDEGSATSGS